MENKNSLVIYQSDDGSVLVDVKLENATVWLTLQQISKLFKRDKSVINRHIGNIFREGELNRSSTVAKFATVQTEGGRRVERDLEYFNLDVIISVGYRVKSLEGTMFRIWANKILRDYLVKGYVLNESLLRERLHSRLEELQNTVRMIRSVADNKFLSANEASGLLSVIADYTLALTVLDEFDHGKLQLNKSKKNECFELPTKKPSMPFINSAFILTHLPSLV